LALTGAAGVDAGTTAILYGVDRQCGIVEYRSVLPGCRQMVKIRLHAREKGWPGFRFGARVVQINFDQINTRI
jgi:hypothetical protein